VSQYDTYDPVRITEIGILFESNGDSFPIISVILSYRMFVRIDLGTEILDHAYHTPYTHTSHHVIHGATPEGLNCSVLLQPHRLTLFYDAISNECNR
jgi:hypothetical protein